MSARWRPVVGSSKMKSVCALRLAAEVRGELEALRLAARQRRERLAEAQVVEADVGQRRSRSRDLAHVGEELERLGDGQVEDVADGCDRC